MKRHIITIVLLIAALAVATTTNHIRGKRYSLKDGFGAVNERRGTFVIDTTSSTGSQTLSNSDGNEITIDGSVQWIAFKAADGNDVNDVNAVLTDEYNLVWFNSAMDDNDIRVIQILDVNDNPYGAPSINSKLTLTWNAMLPAGGKFLIHCKEENE